MQQNISRSNRVILVCSDKYVAKADEGKGGVGYERLIVTSEIVKNIDTHKFIPIIRYNPQSQKTPKCIGERLYIDFEDDSHYSTTLIDLLREILGEPALKKPPLGPNPFSGELPVNIESTRVTGPTGITSSGQAVLEDSWFVKHFETSTAGLKNLSISANMELRVGLHQVINKSQVELLNAVNKSQIHTFGWPIGVVIDNQEYRPKPLHDGIMAELAIQERALSDSPSYDYWSVRNNGDYFLLKSLFEDKRNKDAIFFNTRIVRVAESLMFINNLYNNLGVSPETKLSIRITHRGFSGRTLTSSNLNRDIIPATSNADESQVQIVNELGSLNDHIVNNVKTITAPLFILFDFKEFHDSIYNEIVTLYKEGKVS